MIIMFVINDLGDAQEISTIDDIRTINKSHLRVFNNDGSVLYNHISKSVLVQKLNGIGTGSDNMGLVKRIFDDSLKERSIAKKMKENAKQKAVSSKTASLKREFDLSDDEAEFMARRATNRENRNKKISKVVSGTSSVITSLATAMDQDVGGPRQPSRSGTQQNKQNKNKKSGKHKKKSGTQQRSNNSNNSKKSSQKFNPMDIDADLNMDIPFFEF